MSYPVASAHARSTAFSSSRTLPGQGSGASGRAHRGVSGNRTSQTKRDADEKCLRQSSKILEPLAQRRHLKLHDPETVIQVAPEPAFGDFFSEVPIGGRNDARVDASLAVLADAADLVLLENAKELHLHRQRDVAHFIEQQRASLRRFEQTWPIVQRAGKRAASVAEQFTLEQGVGQRAAIHRDERAGRPRRRIVNVSGETFLANAALADDQNDRINFGHAQGDADQLAHRSAINTKPWLAL